MATTASAEDFVSRMRYLLSNGHQPITFVVGSGLTGGNVAGVQRLVRSMRASLDYDPDKERFDARVVGADWGEKYQQAAEFLIANRGQETLNRIIRTAVLRSCKSISVSEIRSITENEGELRNLEDDPEVWSINAGAEALGILLARMPNDVRGRVITTNFDPHIEIAIKRAGEQPQVRWLDQDGRIEPGEAAGNIEVVHVHGFWRRGDTLHTVHQLTTPRPQLEGSLRESLRGHVVVVVGYSGWPDAFSNFLRDRALEQRFLGMSVMWCHFGEITQAILQNGILRQLSHSSAAVFYERVDANEHLPKVLEAYRSCMPSDSPLPAGDSIRGWTRIEPAFLALRAQYPGSESESARFFDGAEPTWRVALDPLVPTLALSRQIERKFRETQQLIVAGIGPMGEGKSLAIRQFAARMAQESGARILWREPGTRLIVDEILTAADKWTEPLTLVTDDGDLIIEDLVSLNARCRQTARTDIRVVLVASEREWRNAGGFRWRLEDYALVPTTALTVEDAQLIVDAWSTVEGSGLGALSNVPEEKRAIALRKSSLHLHRDEGGSLIGAMLSVRFADTLQSRVENLLGRLDRHQIGPDSTLADAFLTVCLLHCTCALNKLGAQPASLRVLAAASGLPIDSARYLITDPLGREAAVSLQGEQVWSRHPAIAEAAVTVSRRRDPQEIARVIVSLVRGAIHLAPENSSLDPDIYAAAYLSKFLQDGPEAVLAASEACAAAPRRLSYVASRMAALRRAGQTEDAFAVGTEAWTNPKEWIDPEGLPVFLLEWGTDAGMTARPGLNVLLAAMAPMAHERPKPKIALQSLLGQGVGFAALHTQTKADAYASALAGVVFLASECELPDRERGYLANLQGQLRARHTPEAASREDALQAIQTALDFLQSAPPSEIAEYLKHHPVSLSGLTLPIRGR